MTTKNESVQPQLPPLDVTEEDRRAADEGLNTLATDYRAQLNCRERQLLSALAENESLKAELKDANFQHETYQKVATDAAFALGIAPDPETKEWVNVRAMEAEKEGRKYLAERDQYKVQFEDHTKHVATFLNEMHATMVDPVDDWDGNVSGLCARLLEAARQQREQASEHNKALEVIREYVDDESCSYDHHGYCQTHGLSFKPCVNERAKALLTRKTEEG